MHASHDAEPFTITGAAHRPSRPRRARTVPSAPANLGAVVIVMRATCERDPQLLEQPARCGLRVCVVPDGAHILAVVRSLAPAVVLLDLRFGDAGALAACPQIRRTPQVHLIVLADKAPTDAGTLDLGADDFVARPASPREVAARIRAIVRRGPATGAPAGAGLVLDEHRYAATLDGHALDLTPAEFRLLAMLVAAQGGVLTRRQVLESLSARDGASERSVDSLVHHLRRKLDAVRPGEKVIRATYGAGYSLHL